ncbi:M24 family metallopeptidase [Candidatus Formimonas warabiya]|uniref:Peptidase M24 domain-containing protein n=1 Tax=Formimonas warabiya TaxID=1761012 RepID=A0A3G1KSR5_FORW1|nr:M24 family metallopeptidase [Candidatus Formimonas warabiya]ATW25454.1 hypothetical protein DCMF_12300 [Candidatus Formimonas warabiya]
MAELVINQYQYKKETGFDIFEDYLFPKLQLASWKMHGPFALKVGENIYLGGRFHERGYHQGRVIPTNMKPIYIRPYFLFEPQPEKAYPDLASAITELADKELVVDYDIPVAFYTQLLGKIELKFKPNSPQINSRILEQPVDAVEKLLNNSYHAAAKLAEEIMEDKKIPQISSLSKFMERSFPSRFAVLDRYMGENDIQAIIATSPLNVQELAAVPQRTNEGGILAMYIKGGDEVIILHTDELKELRKGRSGILNAPQFLSLVPDGVIGVEDEDMGMGQLIGLGLDSKKVKFASTLLRDWREEIAGADLPFYILCALSTSHAIERALGEAEHRYREDWFVTEEDIFAFFKASVDSFKNKYGIPFSHEIYFANLHSGNRSESPSSYKPGYQLTAANNSIKYDTGIKMYDSYGFLRGVSDLARTLCFNEAGQTVYEYLEKVQLEQGIPAAVPGATGEDVYLAACRGVDKYLDDIKQKNLVPASIIHLEDVYSRDVGHTMGKEEPANLCFKKGEKAQFKVGMICCFELQWGYRGHGFGIEDSFVITEEGPVIFSR